jgi:hypothetical protein
VSEVGETESKFLPVTTGQTEIFLCECGRPDCTESIEIDLETVRVFVKNGRPMIVPEHQPSREAKARAHAAELREQAQALRAQARHQVARAADRSADRHDR